MTGGQRIGTMMSCTHLYWRSLMNCNTMPVCEHFYFDFKDESLEIQHHGLPVGIRPTISCTKYNVHLEMEDGGDVKSCEECTIRPRKKRGLYAPLKWKQDNE